MKKVEYIFTDPVSFGNDDIHNFLAIYSGLFVLVDKNTKQHCYPLIANSLPDHYLIEIESGENFKGIRELNEIASFLLEKGADRNSVVINLGGGKITDLGSFTAAVFKRGVDFINIPTTLLAMVDAVVGGKTGINVNRYKNQIGSFTLARSVIIIPDFLNTLNKEQLLSGFGEIIKHALILSEDHWKELLVINSLDELKNNDIIKKSIDLKEQIVRSDFKETGNRRLLNFGHTVGHAIESCFIELEDEIPHGVAVAYGMILESFLSYQECGLSLRNFRQIRDFILQHFDKPELGKIDVDNFKKYILGDKKNLSGMINLTLLEKVGKGSYDNFLDVNTVLKVLSEFDRICKM